MMPVPRSPFRGKFAKACIIAGTILTAAISSAEERHLSVLGFTADGAYFVLDEFGVLRGSGIPFAVRHHIDVASGSVAAEREATLEDVSGRLDGLDALDTLRDVNGNTPLSGGSKWMRATRTLVYNPTAELMADPRTVSFADPSALNVSVSTTTVTLTETPAPPGTCAQDIPAARVFSLSASRSAEEAGEVHELGAVEGPAVCALEYRLTGVYTFADAEPVRHLLVVVEAMVPGFEGPERTWITSSIPLSG